MDCRGDVLQNCGNHNTVYVGKNFFFGHWCFFIKLGKLNVCSNHPVINSANFCHPSRGGELLR